ncbi:MAG: Tetratricopeptide 2 repeat protein [Solirubrobacterales bacterium]|nr:Tetratricopeptide 2 repeat protein [Solirubrobacterales bacterium]
MTVDEARERARAHFQAGRFSESLLEASTGLSAVPEDLELLLLAGRAGMEVDAPDAVDYLRRATEMAPDDARAWDHLGEALAAEGRTEEADEVFRRAVALDPDDRVALTHLGHTSLAAGRDDEGVGYLARAADSIDGASTAAISLVDMYRSFGQNEEALAQARRLVEATPEDVPAWIDVAQLSLTVGKLKEARAAFERLRELDEIPGHEAYPLHGMMQVELRREQWEAARTLAIQAAAIDPHGLSADVAAFLREQSGEAADEPAPTAAQVEASLEASLTEFRRMHADDRRLDASEHVG